MSTVATPPAQAPAVIPSPVRHVSVEEYQRLPERNENGRRTELIRGIIVEKMSNSPLHSITSGRLNRMFLLALGENYYVRKEEPLALRDSMPEPDVAVIAGVEGDYTQAHPTTALLAVEVSITTLGRDIEKADLYAEAGIPEYWLVRPERGAVEVYTQPRGGFYRERRVFTAAEGATLASSAVPALRLDLATFFAG